jgi:CheY-like chemotaxis protein
VKRSRRPVQRAARILVIDDSVEQPRRLGEIFEQARIPVAIEALTNGVDAVSRVQGWGTFAGLPPPDVAVVDLDLPRLSGMTVLSVIKAQRHAGVIAIAYAHRLRTDQREACEAIGADACVPKPDDFDSYVSLLAEILFFLSMRDDAVLTWCGGGAKRSRISLRR